MSTVVELWVAQLPSLWASYNTFESNAAAAKSAISGKKPFEQSKQVQGELKKLEGLTKTLRDIASRGIGEPEKKLEVADILKMMPQLEGTDKDRDEAVKKFRLAQLSAAQFTDNGKELSTRLKLIAKSAATRRDTATQLRDQFGKLMENVPDPTGSAIKAKLFEGYEAFEEAGGALGGVASAANDAAKKVDVGVEATRKKWEGLTKAFEEAYKKGDAVRKAKKK
jgi:hypothetical protein